MPTVVGEARRARGGHAGLAIGGRLEALLARHCAKSARVEGSIRRTDDAAASLAADAERALHGRAVLAARAAVRELVLEVCAMSD